MLVLAFDTATAVATVALVRDGEAAAERLTTAARLLAAAQELLDGAGAGPGDVGGIAAGTGPGRYTSLRMGLVTARALSFALAAPVAGVSTLDALAAGAPGALPVIDARRSEVFVLDSGPRVVPAAELRVATGRLCIGDGAIRYREALEAAGAIVPPDDDPRHIPWARHHAALAESFGPAELAEPLYLRAPDADRARARRPG
ncbi:MAG: tRNA (adenosine(37)-N6)-threonylcarbamoyltransferase complex dimerization subunit type 1 TsaB [Thermoleophilia bacterium]|nr:tRNA (adenosine(37)-N6)-threonylcarbamoyltransferase complex dimerization subunit type 1 TsaB [Thermoleophilia bacterium]